MLTIIKSCFLFCRVIFFVWQLILRRSFVERNRRNSFAENPYHEKKRGVAYAIRIFYIRAVFEQTSKSK